MAAANDPERAARRQVAACAQGLITTTLDSFDEKTGARGWKAYREAFLRQAESAGSDFVAAAKFAGNIPGPAVYADALVLADDATGAPPAPLPQIRQQALLALLKSGLRADGESLRIIKDCVNAGGRLCWS